MARAPLWNVDVMACAMGAHRVGPLAPAVSGISIDSRSIGPGEAFFAIKGDNRDGHEFVNAAFERRAALAVVAAARRDDFPDLPLLVVADVLEALRDLARAARARSQAKFIGVTGSVGKTGTKEALRLTLSREGETHCSVASYNNHWGVPLSLARCPERARYGVLEIGMNHAGEIEPLARLLRPHVALVTAIEPVHLEFLGSLEAIADAKAEIFCGLEPGGAAVINRDASQFTRIEQSAKRAGAERVVSFGEHPDADAKLIKCSLQRDNSTVQARILGRDITYKLGAPGRHVVLNSLAVLATISLVGADLALAALALSELTPPRGRGARIALELPGGAATLIDESYNANPASMRAALALLGQAQTSGRGRRIAVLGDMLELGPLATDFHRDLAAAVIDNRIDLVFCSGPLMRALWDALPASRRGGYAEDASALQPQVLAALRAGDAVMVKGSLGSRMTPIVNALVGRYRPEAPHPGSAPVSVMNG